jgi:hypothetical protein
MNRYAVTPQLPTNAILAGAYVSLTTHAKSATASIPISKPLTVSRINGWTEIHGIERESLADRSAGKLQLLALSDGLRSVFVDGKQLTTSGTERLVAYGDFESNYDHYARLNVSGLGRAAWLGAKRINNTKWEQLATEFQLLLVSLISGTIAFLYRYFRKLIRYYIPSQPITQLHRR